MKKGSARSCTHCPTILSVCAIFTVRMFCRMSCLVARFIHACGSHLAMPISLCRRVATILFLSVNALGLCVSFEAHAQARFVQTPYEQPKVLIDVYLDHPEKMGAALYWLRSLVNPLIEAPYSMLPEDMDIIVLLHGTELVTVAKKNEARYEEVVQRMRYYASQGVKFKVCGLALQDYGYRREEMQAFIEVTPSAMAELVHWQNRGYALMTPVVLPKTINIDDIR